jgi:exodeoxyribonuclease VII large subunit
MDKDNVFSVSEVNLHIKHILENSVPNLYVEGEIANFTKHASGHMYFSLKDEKSTLRCVFFRSYNNLLNFQPKNGAQVICLGKVTVFEKGGNYQINVSKMMLSGIGDLQRKFEELKEKLEMEGLFSNEHKKEIPEFPETIGVITSSTGAAIQDIQNVLARRFPCSVFLYPATVQGAKAPYELIQGLQYFNKKKNVDVIIIGRGGGSQEDLFCFNDEQLAREIFASKIPVISAVGHEIDFTIADFVADLRAPTPSAAAELVVPNKEDVLGQLNAIKANINTQLQHKIYQHRIMLQDVEARISKYHPRNLLQSYQQELDEITLRFSHQLYNRLQQKKQKLQLLEQSIRELSPNEILKRGYQLMRFENHFIRSAQEVSNGMEVELLMSDGNVNCTLENVKKKKGKMS